MKIYAYNNSSAGAKALAAGLGVKLLKQEGKARHFDKVINWGRSRFDRAITADVLLNKPEAVAKAVNKLEAFRALEGGVAIPEFTTEGPVASQWLLEGATVVVREKLNGHSGEGIKIISLNDEVPAAPLYVKYIPKKAEYRAHVFKDNVFFAQEKKRKLDVPDGDVNWQVRNLDGGFIYANQNVDLHPDGQQEAINAVKALGLDFGAVDLIWNAKKKGFYVLEVNTACGLQQGTTTLAKYIEIFNDV